MDALTQRVADWLAGHPLVPAHVDCATAVMLKILDGKCKMGELDKLVMAALYEAVKEQPGVLLGDEFHALIARAKAEPGEALKNFIYEKRVLAETAISRPVMKAFKAMLRETGLFAGLNEPEEDLA